MRSTTNKLTLVALFVGLSACGDPDPAKSPAGGTTQMSREQGKADWGVWPQLDPTLSCANRCGQLAFDPSAWVYCGCDDSCAASSDCCADKQQVCDAPPPPPCDYADPDRKWATQDWAACPTIRIGCEAGWRPFQEPGCGCGCEKATTPTCNHSDPKRDYYAQQQGGCAAMFIACDPGWELFDDACGCGCEDRVPDCIRALIQQLGSEPVANPPASITLYEYNGQPVYFLPQRCCDIPSTLYDAQCNVICEPDGGFSGAGDGRCPDFFQIATEQGQIWQDPR